MLLIDIGADCEFIYSIIFKGLFSLFSIYIYINAYSLLDECTPFKVGTCRQLL